MRINLLLGIKKKIDFEIKSQHDETPPRLLFEDLEAAFINFKEKFSTFLGGYFSVSAVSITPWVAGLYKLGQNHKWMWKQQLPEKVPGFWWSTFRIDCKNWFQLQASKWRWTLLPQCLGQLKHVSYFRSFQDIHPSISPSLKHIQPFKNVFFATQFHTSC